MAFRAMPVSARAVLDRLVGAMIALLDAGAKCGGSACADVAECLELLARQRIAPALQELLSVLAEDIGDFQWLVAHHWRASLSERSMGCSWRASKGLVTACRRLLETCR